MKTKMFFILFLYCFLMPPLIGQHQAIISPAGASNETGEIILEWTLGEMAVSTYSFSDQIFTEGFHQADPNEKEIEFINPKSLLSIQCFPNPFVSGFTVSWNQLADSAEYSEAILACIVTNVYGEEISRKTMKDGQIQFNLSDMASGIYFVHIENIVRHIVQVEKLIKL